MNGLLTDWDEARVHVWDEIAIRGVSAFEGVLCVWRPERDQHLLVAGDWHFRRLQRSASLVDLPMPFSRDQLDQVISHASELFHGTCFYARPTAFALRGRSSLASDSTSGWFVGAFPTDVVECSELLLATIAWPSRSGSLVPAAAKTGGSYLDFRIVEQRRLRAGADVSLTVDPMGNLVEADGSGLLVVSDGEVLVPQVSGHALDSVTRRILIDLARSLAAAVVGRPVHWSEGHGSVLLLGGTLAGVRIAKLQDSLIEPTASDLELAGRLRRGYYDLLLSGDIRGEWVRHGRKDHS